MAEESNEDNLSPERTEQLLHFQDLTGIEDIARCRELLSTHGWNIESAVQARFAENDLDDRVEMNHHSDVVHRGAGVRRSAPNLIHNDLRMPVVNLNPPDQRVFLHLVTSCRSLLMECRNALKSKTTGIYNENSLVFVVHRRPIGIMGWGYWIISFPFHFFYSKFISILRFIYRLLRPDPRAVLTDPVGDVRSFIDNFNITYGLLHPDFFLGTYSQALNEAKKELKFLLVYLHGDEHQDTPEFCRSVLCTRRITELVNSRMLFWACNTNSPEGYRVSQALRENTYPFLAVIVLRQNRMTVVARLEGFLESEELITRLLDVMDDNIANLITAQADREERSFNQRLRQQQDEAYQQSLVADQEKERQRKKEREIQEEKEREAQELVMQELRRVEEIARLKEEMRDHLPEEPDSSDSDCVRIMLKLPNGTRLERRFRLQDPITHLYNYVYVHEAAPDNFQIVKNFPRTVIPGQIHPHPTCDATPSPPPPTFEQVGLKNAELLFVHDNDA